MNIHHQTEAWLFYGMCDLYFSFYLEDGVFDYHKAFFAIMALEKHLKACIIYSQKDKFTDLDEKESFEKVLDIAKGYGHDFQKMACEVEKLIPDGSFTQLLDQSHGSYSGRKLIEVLQDAHIETRYPTKKDVSMSFPAEGSNKYHFNPLSSPGPDYFIRSTCSVIVESLEGVIDLNKLLSNVKGQYQHQEPFNRFQNIYLAGKWG